MALARAPIAYRTYPCLSTHGSLQMASIACEAVSLETPNAKIILILPLLHTPSLLARSYIQARIAEVF